MTCKRCKEDRPLSNRGYCVDCEIRLFDERQREKKTLRDKMRQKNRKGELGNIILGFWIVWVVICLILLGLMIWVIWHFVAKWW